MLHTIFSVPNHLAPFDLPQAATLNYPRVTRVISHRPPRCGTSTRKRVDHFVFTAWKKNISKDFK